MRLKSLDQINSLALRRRFLALGKQGKRERKLNCEELAVRGMRNFEASRLNADLSLSAFFLGGNRFSNLNAHKSSALYC